MGKIVVSEFMTLDGVVEAPEKWQSDYLSADIAVEEIQAQIHAADAFLFGRHTYNDFAPFWSTQTNNEFGIADKLNSAPKYVVSSTLQTAGWNNATLIKGSLVEEITRLKQQINGNIGVTGSAMLVQALTEAHLVDEYRLMIHPIVVGSGKRLFKAGDTAMPLRLVSSTAYQGGIVVLVYHPNSQS